MSPMRASQAASEHEILYASAQIEKIRVFWLQKMALVLSKGFFYPERKRGWIGEGSC